MINFNDKNCDDLLQLISVAGHWYTLRDGVFVTSDDAAVQSIIDQYTPQIHAARQTQAIRNHANKVIVSRYPEWQQRNMLARMMELNVILFDLSPDEVLEAQAIKAAWAWIKTVREYSNNLVTVIASQPFPDCVNFDWRAGWPD